MSDHREPGHDQRSASKKAEKLGLGRSTLTIVLCADEKTAKCASAQAMRESWKHLRSIAKKHRKDDEPTIVALQVACPGICRFGPIAGVFPSDTWYGGCDPKMLDRIIAQHLDDTQEPNGRVQRAVIAPIDER